LEVRRVKDFLPRALSWTVVAVFVGAAVHIGWVATLPGYEAVPFTGQEHNQGFSRIGGDGRIQGSVLAACLGSGWLVLALGTVLVLVLISRRRQLEALDAAENGLLRTIAMNRLLRTVATIAAGLAAVGGNFSARPDPAANASSWTNPAGFAAFVVLLVMWAWAPPKLPGVQTGGAGAGMADSPAAAHPAARLSVSLGAAMGLAPFLVAPLGFFLPGARLTEQPIVLIGLIAAAILVVAGSGELLLQRNYGSPAVARTWPRQPVSPALLTTAITAVVLLAAITMVTATGGLKVHDAGFDGSGRWPAAVLATVAVAAAGSLPLAAARMRHGIPTGIPGLDAALRAITVHRVVRTMAAYCLVQGGALLITDSNAWPPLLGLPAVSAAWQPAVIAGAALAGTGVLVAVIPVRGFARVPAAWARSVAEGQR
jgi:hypothetical protein